MITLIEAFDFRCLRYIRQPLERFHVLVGPNASGKTTFLDTIAFMGRLVSDGLEAAIEDRTQNFSDLVWRRASDRFELAVEALIPNEVRARLNGYDTIRYEIAIGRDPATEGVSILAEKVLLKTRETVVEEPTTLFPLTPTLPESNTIITPKGKRNTRTIVNKVPDGNDNFYSEIYQESGKGWAPAFKLGPRKSALGNLPADETKFPAATWLKSLLGQGVQTLALNSLLLRKASPPGQVRGFKPDGSNLPWVVDDLQKRSSEHYREWIRHLQTALPSLQSIRTVEREDDRHRYLILAYEGGLEVPSWVASDGTLRLLALTLPAYLPNIYGVYLIEEPENGIHPRAVETMLQSLSSVYDAQILMATHSPVILSAAQSNQVLCFGRDPEGATAIVAGHHHPALRDWKGETNLGVLFASGVLG